MEPNKVNTRRNPDPIHVEGVLDPENLLRKFGKNDELSGPTQPGTTLIERSIYLPIEKLETIEDIYFD